MSKLNVTDAKTRLVDGKVVIESEELAQAIQDRTLNPSAEDEDNWLIQIQVTTIIN